MQIGENQKRIKFCIVEANFCKNLNLFNFNVLSFKHFMRIYIGEEGVVCFCCFFYVLGGFFCSSKENGSNLKLCLFYNLKLETRETWETWKVILATMCRSTKYFPQIWSEVVTLKFPLHKIPFMVCQR